MDQIRDHQLALMIKEFMIDKTNNEGRVWYPDWPKYNRGHLGQFLERFPQYFLVVWAYPHGKHIKYAAWVKNEIFDASSRLKKLADQLYSNNQRGLKRDFRLELALSAYELIHRRPASEDSIDEIIVWPRTPIVWFPILLFKRNLKRKVLHLWTKVVAQLKHPLQGLNHPGDWLGYDVYNELNIR